jgi:hypothetical protein
MDSEPHSRPYTQGRADSVSQTREVCSLRMGITTALRLAGKKAAIISLFLLYLLTTKQDNSVHE